MHPNDSGRVRRFEEAHLYKVASKLIIVAADQVSQSRDREIIQPQLLNAVFLVRNWFWQNRQRGGDLDDIRGISFIRDIENIFSDGTIFKATPYEKDIMKPLAVCIDCYLVVIECDTFLSTQVVYHLDQAKDHLEMAFVYYREDFLEELLEDAPK